MRTGSVAPALKLQPATGATLCDERPRDRDAEASLTNEKAASWAGSFVFICLLVQATACAFHFLRQPSRPNAPRPVEECKAAANIAELPELLTCPLAMPGISYKPLSRVRHQMIDILR
jgi:hypothetical protein